MKADYQSYIKDELVDVMRSIAKEAWPERYSEIKNSFKNLIIKLKIVTISR